VALLMSDELSREEDPGFKTKIKVFVLIITLFIVFSIAVMINDLKKYILEQVKCFWKK